MYAFCEEERVPTRRCGKLVVATRESQLATRVVLRPIRSHTPLQSSPGDSAVDPPFRTVSVCRSAANRRFARAASS